VITSAPPSALAGVLVEAQIAFRKGVDYCVINSC